MFMEEKNLCRRCGEYPAEYNQTYCEFCLGIVEEDEEENEIYKTLEDRIMKEVADFCRECPSNNCCPEDECVLWRIEQICLDKED